MLFHETMVLGSHPIIRYTHVHTKDFKVVDRMKWQSAVLCSLPTVTLCCQPTLFMGQRAKWIAQLLTHKSVLDFILLNKDILIWNDS